MNVWQRIRSFFKCESHSDPEIHLTETGFALLDPDTRAAIRTVQWADISRIQTYKLDLLTTDCICLLFGVGSAEQPVQISEEWKGFSDLVVCLPQAFPSIPGSWYAEAMTPPFETNLTVLYEDRGLLQHMGAAEEESR
jgi:hypothetical protein